MRRTYKLLALGTMTLPLLAAGGCDVTDAVLQTIGLAFRIVEVWV